MPQVPSRRDTGPGIPSQGNVEIKTECGPNVEEIWSLGKEELYIRLPLHGVMGDGRICSYNWINLWSLRHRPPCGTCKWAVKCTDPCAKTCMNSLSFCSRADQQTPWMENLPTSVPSLRGPIQKPTWILSLLFVEILQMSYLILYIRILGVNLESRDTSRDETRTSEVLIWGTKRNQSWNERHLGRQPGLPRRVVHLYRDSMFKRQHSHHRQLCHSDPLSYFYNNLID